MQGTGGGGGSVKKENPSDSLLGQGGWWQEEPHLLPFGLGALRWWGCHVLSHTFVANHMTLFGCGVTPARPFVHTLDLSPFYDHARRDNY
jgi:hypothetical protein